MKAMKSQPKKALNQSCEWLVPRVTLDFWTWSSKYHSRESKAKNQALVISCTNKIMTIYSESNFSNVNHRAGNFHYWNNKVLQGSGPSTKAWDLSHRSKNWEAGKNNHLTSKCSTGSKTPILTENLIILKKSDTFCTFAIYINQISHLKFWVFMFYTHFQEFILCSALALL